jgi:hypothetical protein
MSVEVGFLLGLVALRVPRGRSLRPSDFAPAFGRAVCRFATGFDARLKPRFTSAAKNSGLELCFDLSGQTAGLVAKTRG